MGQGAQQQPGRGRKTCTRAGLTPWCVPQRDPGVAQQHNPPGASSTGFNALTPKRGQAAAPMGAVTGTSPAGRPESSPSEQPDPDCAAGARRRQLPWPFAPPVDFLICLQLCVTHERAWDSQRGCGKMGNCSRCALADFWQPKLKQPRSSRCPGQRWPRPAEVLGSGSGTRRDARIEAGAEEEPCCSSGDRRARLVSPSSPLLSPALLLHPCSSQTRPCEAVSCST